jgi:hypothetical protein
MSLGLIRWGGLAAMVGAALWAITPLREPILDERFPGHPAFRPYNFVLLVIAVLLIMDLLGLHVRYKGSYGRLSTAGVLVILVGYALLFVGSILAILLYLNGLRGLIMAGQDLGFLGTLIAGVSAILYGMAFWRARAASGLGALPLIITLLVGIASMILVSAIGCVDIAGLQLTDLYGGTWVILGSQLRLQGGRQRSPRASAKHSLRRVTHQTR